MPIPIITKLLYFILYFGSWVYEFNMKELENE